MKKLQNPDLGLLLLRLAVGIVFVYAGWFKLNNMEMVTAGFASMGFAPWLAYLVGYVEFLGGIAMILGLFVQYAGILLAIVMLVALVKVHAPNGYSLANNGYEYVLMLMLSSLAIVTLGAGKYSVGKLLKKKEVAAQV